jgi:hypothetical protein
MIRLNRALAYAVYCLLTVGAFALANAYPNDVTTGLATNLLAGLIIVTFIDSLFRMTEKQRLRPLRIAALKANAIVKSRLEAMLSSAIMIANGHQHLPSDDIKAMGRTRFDVAVAEGLSEIQLRDGLKDSLSEHFARDAEHVCEAIDDALEKFGSAQEPDTAYLLAEIGTLAPFQDLQRAARSGWPVSYLSAVDWSQIIDAHNRLADSIDREVAQFPQLGLTSKQLTVFDELIHREEMHRGFERVSNSPDGSDQPDSHQDQPHS